MTISFRNLDAGESVILQSNGRDTHHIIGGVSNAAGLGHVIEDEGTPLTQRATLNFVGTGVTVTDDAITGKTVVTIPSETKAAEWQLKDTDANTVGFKDTTWEVPFAATITGATVYNPAKPAVATTCTVSIWRATTTTTGIVWDSGTLNPAAFGPSSEPRYVAPDVSGWTVALSAGDLLAVEVISADATLSALVVTLEMAV